MIKNLTIVAVISLIIAVILTIRHLIWLKDKGFGKEDLLIKIIKEFLYSFYAMFILGTIGAILIFGILKFIGLI